MSSEKESTRIRILKSTWVLLEKGDPNSVRMSDIAKMAELSRQAVYLHFPNRAELLIATVRYLDDVHNVDERLHKSRTTDSGVERLSAWIEAWGNYIPTIYGVSKALMTMKDTDKEAFAAWNDRMQAVREGCNAAVSALKSDNTLRETLSETEATDMLWTLLSVRSWEQLRYECGWSQEQYISHLKDAAVQILVRT